MSPPAQLSTRHTDPSTQSPADGNQTVNQTAHEEVCDSWIKGEVGTRGVNPQPSFTLRVSSCGFWGLIQISRGRKILSWRRKFIL
ncbi:hypothetical protein EYF80_044105 [Liparis tanakae]|uniref:Uncharacterized protein n=1 Tax=Liparis tanakae TaxID=230148 RepID=A0A4Z2FYS6_9TELE|nr:hypothetical protein EYF80_044105 [Liparis tanakae]